MYRPAQDWTAWKPNNSTPSKNSWTTWHRVQQISGGIFDYAGKRDRLTEVVAALEQPEVWNDAKRAQELGRERHSLESTVSALESIDSGIRDTRELFDMAREEGDFDTDTRFCISWFKEFGWNRGSFGRADDLALAFDDLGHRAQKATSTPSADWLAISKVSTPRSNCSSSGGCSTIRRIPAPASWKSRPVPAVPRLRIGHRCCSACTCAIPSAASTRSTC